MDHLPRHCGVIMTLAQTITKNEGLCRIQALPKTVCCRSNREFAQREGSSCHWCRPLPSRQRRLFNPPPGQWWKLLPGEAGFRNPRRAGPVHKRRHTSPMTTHADGRTTAPQATQVLLVVTPERIAYLVSPATVCTSSLRMMLRRWTSTVDVATFNRWAISGDV